MTDGQWLCRDRHQFASSSKTTRTQMSFGAVAKTTPQFSWTQLWHVEGTSSPATSLTFLKWLLGESWASMSSAALVLINPHLYSGEIASV